MMNMIVMKTKTQILISRNHSITIDIMKILTADGRRLQNGISGEFYRKLLVLGYDEVPQNSDLDDICFYNWFQQTKRNRAISNFESRSKIKSYIGSVVLKNTPSEFIYHFRVSHEVFETLLMSLPPRNKSIRGRPLLDNSFCLILTLWMLANEKETYRQTGERFGISESTAFRVFKSTISSISNLEENYIVWPRGLAAQRNIDGFHNLRKVPFPGAFCVVDCSHVRINGSLSDNSYLNRNHYHSVIIQGICDFEGKFINVFVGYPGSAHDAAVWANSPVYKKLIQNHYEVIPPNCFILGDSAYPLSEFLMKPYRDNGHLELHQKKFNTILSSSRVIIEQAFGSLKGRFRRLKGIETLCVEAVSETVIAACVIHNMCSDQDFDVDNLTNASFFNSEEDKDNIDSQKTSASDVLNLRESIAKKL